MQPCVGNLLATGVRDCVVLSWQASGVVHCYAIYEAMQDTKASQKLEYTLIKRTKRNKLVLKRRAPGNYFYYVVPCILGEHRQILEGPMSKVVSTTVVDHGVSTIKNFLKVAIAPVGLTMYVWGGGWNHADTKAGYTARRIGQYSKWSDFAAKQDASYDYQKYRYQIDKGLDCSGYVGWTVYNILNSKSRKRGYVFSASRQARVLANFGFGTYKDARYVLDYKPGDIMSSGCRCCNHVWIVIGMCKDGSVVLVHASPQGVQINGTFTKFGDEHSEAIALARFYMEKYYATWYGRFPRVSCGLSYLTHYGQMRWDTGGDKLILTDPDGYLQQGAETILADLFAQ